MKTTVRIKSNVPQSELKAGDEGYIDGYATAADGRPYAVVVVGQTIDLVPIYLLVATGRERDDPRPRND